MESYTKMMKNTSLAFLSATLLYSVIYIIVISLCKLDINHFQNGLIIMLITRVILCENKQKELEDDSKYCKSSWLE